MPSFCLLLALAISFTPLARAQGYIEKLRVEQLYLPSQTASTVPYVDSNKKITSSAVTPTELGYLSGVTSAIQTQLNAKAATSSLITSLTGDVSASGTGAVSATIASGAITNTKVATAAGIGVTKLQALTASRPVSTDASGFLQTPSAQLAPSLGGTGLDASASSGILKFNIGTPTVASGQVVNADVSASAGIGVTKLQALTANQFVVTDASGFLTTSATGGGGGGSAGINMLSSYNNNAELNATTYWSKSGGGTLTTTSTSSNVANGTYAFSYDASATSDYAISDARSIPAGLYGKNCLAEFYYKGFDSTITVQVYDGTNVIASQALSAATSYAKAQINFVCPQSGTLAVRFLASGNSAIGYFDEVHLGSANNVLTDTVITPWEAYSPTFTGFGSVTAYSFYSRRVGDTLQFKGTFTCATSTATQARITYGYGGVNGNVTASSTAKITSGGEVGGVGFYSVSNAVSLVVIPIPSQTYFALGVQTASTGGYAGANGNGICSSGQVMSLFGEVPIEGWSSVPVAAINNSDAWRVDANISGANPSLGGSNVTTYTGIENGSLTLSNASGSGVLTAQIPCSSTNSPSGTTCSVGNESVGVSFTIPRAGDALACVNFGHNLFNGAGGSAAVTFQIVETPSNAQTISQEGKTRISSQHQVASSSMVFPYRLCGTFSFASAGQKTLRLMYEQSTGGTVTTNAVLADADTGNGQRDIHWEVYPIDNRIPAPVIVGSVTSSSTSAERTERAVLVRSTSSISSQSGSWLSSISQGTTAVTNLNIASGIFSAAPTCVCVTNSTAATSCGVTCSSATSCVTTTWSGNTLTNEDNVKVICMGPR